MPDLIVPAMTRTLVVGVDPGATTGICALAFDTASITTRRGQPAMSVPIVLECEASDAETLVADTILAEYPGYRHVVAVEQFVVSQRAGRSATAAAGRVTRELIAQLGYRCDVMRVRPAGLVKPWATDRMLKMAGLYEPTRGRNHARDAARHALFEAVHSKVMPNPLSGVAKALAEQLDPGIGH